MSSDKAQKLFDEAMQANLTGDSARAADLLKQVVEADPERVDAWVALSKLLTDYDERRMALTTVLNLDPDNAYAQQALESVEKPKTGADVEGEVVPGITRKQARTVAIGLGAYTLLVCGVTFLIVFLIRGSKTAETEKKATQDAVLAALVINQTETQTALTAAAIQMTDVVVTQTEAAKATVIAEISPTPTVPNKRATLPPVNTDTPVPTEVTFRVLDLPPALPGHVLAWGGKDVRSDDYLPLRSYNMGAPGTPFELMNRELGRNPLISRDGTVTVFEQWRSDGSRLYMNILDPVTPGGALDTLVSNKFLISALRDPSLSDDNKRIAFIANDYNTKTDGAYIADLTNLAFPKFYQLSLDTATYSGITLSPDGTKAVAVRNDGSTTDLVVFDLTTLAAAAPQPTVPPAPLNTPADGAPTLPPPPTAQPPSIPIRPLTTDGNTLVEANPAFSPDGTQVVYDAFSSSTPNNRDLYTVTVGATTSATTPIMTLDGNDIAPSFSPDSHYVVFASDRGTGIYNIYIYDVTSRTTYQLTADGTPVYPGSWSN
jgi:hypothetical protein